MKTAIIANDATESDALFCALAVTAPTLPTDWIMSMPAGRHAISATRRGKQWRGEVAVTPESAAALEAQRAALTAKGRKPYFDFNHDDGEASFWPDKFACAQGWDQHHHHRADHVGGDLPADPCAHQRHAHGRHGRDGLGGHHLPLDL